MIHRRFIDNNYEYLTVSCQFTKSRQLNKVTFYHFLPKLTALQVIVTTKNADSDNNKPIWSNTNGQDRLPVANLLPLATTKHGHAGRHLWMSQ